MTLVAWTPDDEENWQRMMQTIAQRRPKPEPKPKASQANNVPSVASPNLPPEAFAGVRRPDVSQGLPGAAGVSLAQRKTAASQPEIPAVDPLATSGMNHQDATLADITAQDDQRYEALKQQRYRRRGTVEKRTDLGQSLREA